MFVKMYFPHCVTQINKILIFFSLWMLYQGSANIYIFLINTCSIMKRSLCIFLQNFSEYMRIFLINLLSEIQSYINDFCILVTILCNLVIFKKCHFYFQSLYILIYFYFHYLQAITPSSVCLCVSDGSLLPLMAAKLGAKKVSEFIL